MQDPFHLLINQTSWLIFLFVLMMQIFHLTFLTESKRISLKKWLISYRGSNFSCWYNMVPDLKLWPSHGHVNPVCVGPPAQVLLMVSVVYSVVKFIINLRQPVLSSILVINYKINFILSFLKCNYDRCNLRWIFHNI